MERSCQPGTRCLTIALFTAGAVFAQPQDAHPTYEAVNIKLNTSGGDSSSSHGTLSQAIMTNMTLRRLIERAYGVKPNQLAGPDWLNSVHFDIAAKYPHDSKPADHPLMLRTLLEDRFKLTTHRETRDIPGYVLVVAKGGFKLKPVEPGDDGGTDHTGGRVHELKATKLSMKEMADFVARMLGEVVIDKTGLDGVYTFELHWSNEDKTSDGVATSPSLPTALQETLGLRLQPQKVPVEFLVVDHAERVPTEN